MVVAISHATRHDWCPKGFFQIPDISSNKVFLSGLRFSTIKLLFVFFVCFCWKSVLFGIKIAIVNAPLKKKVNITQPETFASELIEVS